MNTIVKSLLASRLNRKVLGIKIGFKTDTSSFILDSTVLPNILREHSDISKTNVKVYISDKVLISVLQKRTNPMMAFMAGMIRIQGNNNDALKIVGII